ncbi:MAG: SUMF1/EgtB/PvdO family nonheme iron enzyme [Nitrosomonas sp.]|uniref:SUMF1/EgtB/PvdO family nonheme iron enzyme n=1 Tax=Nitrosomonas sp. TaxID=42353 RepID=UPI001E0C46BE|nr:SUMF1/EgtB/PvdO family nonheme iron enzyme [Nitrosomonas sp.]MBX9895313.1 SUMF1/EgtB/PvdO family nonheme iron enzyme [Nitrosomonas sp.]
MTKVFISYSHDSEEHRERVLGLSERLRADGIETILDRYVGRGSPPEGWPRWMLNALDAAAQVLCVCTESYYRRFRGHEQPGKGKGVDWEGAVITQELYDTRQVSSKFIPVLFDPTDELHIPEPLRPQTYYVLNNEASYQALYDALLNQSGVEPGAIGALKIKPRAIGQPLTFDAQSPEITVYLNELIHNHYAKHAQRYVALEATERRSMSLERAMATAMDTDVILRDFNLEPTTHETAQETPYSDALEAYRALRNKPVRRLAVLGEPGAGKSFSLQRIAVEYAQQALQDADAPVPLLLPLGFWTQDDMPLAGFINAQLGPLGCHFTALRDQRRAVLMLDGLNEIPPGQRAAKIGQIETLARDERFVSVIVSCREKDFTGDCRLPFDTLLLQPLKPSQIMTFLQRTYMLQNDGIDAGVWAEERFWQLAGGSNIREVWEVWRQAGADLDFFWSAEKVPGENPKISAYTSLQQDNLWRETRFNPRNLLRLAANPYLLFIITALPQVPRNRAQLFQGFLNNLYRREKQAREKRFDGNIPVQQDWQAALTALAAAMQRANSSDDGAQTSLPRDQCPMELTQALLDFSIDANVLQVENDAIRFSHQLLQEYLASRLLLDASRTGNQPARAFWPQANWWERSGWEVVAEIAAESCGDDSEAQTRLITWLAQANPEVACAVWQHLGQIDLPHDVLSGIADEWLPRMTDVTREPKPWARAAIGRALGYFGLDKRKGIGLRADGLPDIDWVKIPSGAFIYQDDPHPPLSTFHIARYPVTNAQFQAFIDAGGYQNEVWWQGLAHRFDAPIAPAWDEPNAPRESVSWFESIAFYRWLSAQLGFMVTLPTEQQWERAARGAEGLQYPWGNEFRQDFVNCAGSIGRTSAAGIYPQGGSPEGVMDLVGNVWEWCLNEYSAPENCPLSGDKARVVRGGSCLNLSDLARSSARDYDLPDARSLDLGFRVLCESPIG